MKYVLAVIGFGLLVIVHELGHFIMAKVNKVKVLEFCIGMGPKILSYKGKETTYALCLFPIGGACMMLNGEENIDDPGCLLNKSHLRRISVMIAGVFMNFLLALVLFTAYFSHIGFGIKTLDEVTANGAAYVAGFKSGDEITKVNDKKMNTYDDVSIAISESKGNDLDIEYLRDGEVYKATLSPQYNEEYEKYMIGVSFKLNKNPGIYESFKHGLLQIKSLIKETLSAIAKLITFRGDFKKDVGGPVSVVRISATAAQMGIWPLVYLIGILSISLAVFNFLPFPALDGGHTIILLIEMITRRKIPEKIQVGINTFGFICLMILMLAVTIKDILFPIKF